MLVVKVKPLFNPCISLFNRWNAAIQDQAIDRCHRFGQKRGGGSKRTNRFSCHLYPRRLLTTSSFLFSVLVYQFAMPDFIEERMYRLQESKTALGNDSLRKLSADERK